MSVRVSACRCVYSICAAFNSIVCGTNVQAAVFNIDDVLATAGMDDLSSESMRDMTFADIERKVEMVASSEIGMLKMLKQWLRSDEDFGLTSSEAGKDEHFPHFHRWLKASKAGDGGGAVGK